MAKTRKLSRFTERLLEPIYQFMFDRFDLIDRETRLAAIMMLPVLIVVGLMIREAAIEGAERNKHWSTYAGTSVWTDPQTGCRYLRGRTALFKADGSPDCGARP